MRSFDMIVASFFCSFLYFTVFKQEKQEAGKKVLASQLSLDCRARRSGWVGSTTL